MASRGLWGTMAVRGRHATAPRPSRNQPLRESSLQPIGVLVVDPAAPNRHGLRAILKSAPGIDVVGEAACGSEAVALAERLRPDVVLMDAVISEEGADDPSRRIRELVPGTKILFLLTYVAQLDAGLSARADGYWLKDGGRGALVQAIRSLAAPDPVS